MSETSDAEFLPRLSAREFDFIDIGCSKGGSMQFATRKLGGTKGIGFDVDPAKLIKAQDAGWTVFNFDTTKDVLPPKTVRFVTCFHTLEHLESFNSTVKLLQNAIRSANDFVAIRHPYFDLDGVLASHGVKFYHSDWSGHTNHLTSLDHYKLARTFLGKRAVGYYVYGRQPIDLSTGEHLVPLAAPINTSTDKVKNFTADCSALPAMRAFKELFVLISLKQRQSDDWLSKILRRCRVRPEDLILSSFA